MRQAYNNVGYKAPNQLSSDWGFVLMEALFGFNRLLEDDNFKSECEKTLVIF